MAIPPIGWRRQLKTCERSASQIVHHGGPGKEARMKRAVRDYLSVGRAPLPLKQDVEANVQPRRGGMFIESGSEGRFQSSAGAK